MKNHGLAAAALLGLFPVAADAVHEVDLASDGAWRLSADGGAERSIVVPGGGWNSDLQKPRIPTMEGVGDYVVYRRRFTVPAIYGKQVVKIKFGAVNYGAEVYVDGKLAGSHVGPAVPFAVDVSAFAAPGEHELRVKAYHRRHYILANGKSASVPVAFDFPENSKEWCHWSGNSKYAYGITRSVKLLIYPPVYIEDVFARPSVADDSLSLRVWVRNTTGRRVPVVLNSLLSSWNGDKWEYPAIPKLSATVEAGGLKELSSKIGWGLGRASYWWPNIPFKEDYQAKLHFVDLRLSANGKQLDRRRQRFGFVEWGEGKFYYTVNGVRVMQISDSTCESQMSCYDAYGTAPAFLAANPSTGRKGCAETWKRYMRVGFNINRLCCSPPTELMLNAADEVGFMLMPEAPIWGNRLHGYNPEVTPDSIRSLVRLCRNHPAVARYSLANEVRPHKLADSAWIDLIGVANKADGSRPLSYDLHRCGHGRVEDGHGGHAAIMEHYPRIKPADGSFRACGECCWETDGLLNWAYTVRKLRLYDWAYGSCWSWMNYWPNFLEGMSHDRHAWKPQNAPDRTTGKNGMGSPIVKFVQKSLNPYLIIDRGIRKLHKQAKSRVTGDGSLRWPQTTDCYRPGEEVAREIEIFNGGLSDGAFRLAWEARLGSPTGAVLAAGKTPAVEIKAGFHRGRSVSFRLPAAMDSAAKCFYLVMRSVKDGETVFVENRMFFNVLSKGEAGYSVEFAGMDTETHGSFRSKYGRNGFVIAKDENNNMPGFVKLEWSAPPKQYVWNADSDDPRALPVFSNENSVRNKRIAACWHDRRALNFTIDTGLKPQRVSLYFLNWDGKNPGITVSVTCGAGHAVKELPKNYSDAYMSFDMRGKARFTVTGVRKPILSGVFFDD